MVRVQAIKDALAPWAARQMYLSFADPGNLILSNHPIPACGPLTADLAEALDLAWRRSGWPWGRPGRLGPGPGIGRRQARGFVSLGLAAPAERASRLGVAREVSVTTVLPPPLAHRCVSTRQHDQESEVTRTRCLRGPSAAGRPMEAGQSACNVAVRLCPARRYAAASRRAWSAPVAAYEPLPGVRQRRSECLRIRPGTAVPLSPADLSASRQTMKLSKYAGYPRPRTGSSIPASEKISCSRTSVSATQFR